MIDADNIPYANIKGMLEEIAKYGTPTFKRIYGDWTRPNLSGWKGVLLENAITPIQQYSYTKGKNSTDSALIIDAMDILYTGHVDGFCIISSDSDFTRLATRLREAGKKVFGIGEKKTPVSFIASCNKFIYIEILNSDPTNASLNEPIQKTTKQNPRKGRTKAQDLVTGAATNGKRPVEMRIDARETEPATTTSRNSIIEPVQPMRMSAVKAVNEALFNLIGDSISDLAEEDGWVGLSTLGALIMKKQPDFDSRNYGFKKLVELIKSIPQIEVQKRETGRNNVSQFYVRMKESV